MQKDPLIGKTVSHYKIVDYLGGGGMGMVYKAEDIKLKRTVALKFLPLEFTRNPEAKTRFMKEAHAAASLDHPRIGTIYEVDETDDGHMYIAMAFYEGETLKDVHARGPIPLKRVIELVLQIANGLASAHEKEITHRDIKPANIMITEDGFVKIVDFGLAKLGDSTKITKSGMAMGTPAYMSPEQVKGTQVDHRSDIWSLGIILYELLTRRLPFRGDNEMAMLYNIVNEEPAPA
ncbi:MAG: serine/threonine protein kinase, partial [Caldithrix sp.]